MSKPRIFEYHDDKSNKFWEILQAECDVSTRWGKVGSAGQSKTKTFDSVSLAEKEYAKLVKEKTSKGYVECSASLADDHKDAEDVEDDLMDRLLAALPEDMQDLLNEVEDEQDAPVVVTDPHPVNIRLQRELPGSIAGNERSLPWLAWLKACKAKHLGDFQILEFPVAMQVYRDTKNRLILISYFGDQCWVDVYLQDANEISWTWMNAPSTDGFHPPWSNVTHRPELGLSELVDLADQSGVVSAEPDHTAKTFIPTFTKGFQLSMMWRNSIFVCDQIRPAPARDIEQKVFQVAREYYRNGHFYKHEGLNSLTSGRQLLQSNPTELIEILISAFRQQECLIELFRYDVLEDTCVMLLKRQLNYRPLDVDCLTTYIERLMRQSEGGRFLSAFLGAVERFQKVCSLSKSTEARLRSIRGYASDSYFDNFSKERARINAILGDNKLQLPMVRGEAWPEVVDGDLQRLPEPERVAWTLLFNHCTGATDSKYDAAWSKRAAELLDTIGAEAFHEQFLEWLPALNLPRLEPPTVSGWPPPLSIEEANQDILRGLAWCVSLRPTAESPRLLATLAISAYRKIPRVGSRAVRVGNACVMALNSIGTAECVAKLSLLKIKVKNGTALRYIDSQLQKTAERLNVSSDELAEISVPVYGMDEVGKRSETLGDFRAELQVNLDQVQLNWFKADGTPQKSVPAAVKSSHADELKELKTDVQELEKMLSAQRDRLEGLYLQNRSWNYDNWRERYLDHPLVGTLARRLIWEFTDANTRRLGIFYGDELRGVDGRPLAKLNNTSVKLWHPLHDPPDMITAWRTWLMNHEVCQPFKQAHREIYLLTPAELNTSTYSNRFAAHILRQAQYRALAQTRSWNVGLLGAWDGGDMGTAKRTLTAWNLRAELCVTATNEVEEFQDVNHVSTDQVLFYAGDQAAPLPLIDIPALAFSEIMRDVDLFVGVSSVGNDANWRDQGGTRGHQEYWRQYAFGELAESSKTRREVLQHLLPRLKIASQCRVEERFLVVQGKLRTYKIHLGSTNILMEPNDEYLCIVPDRSDTASHSVYLPFEGDRILSMLLSKAFLLAADDKIKDHSIVAQLRR